MTKRFDGDLVNEVAETMKSLYFWDEEYVTDLYRRYCHRPSLDEMIEALAEYSVRENDGFCEEEIERILERE